jgi:hypothetical protein
MIDRTTLLFALPGFRVLSLDLSSLGCSVSLWLQVVGWR